VKRKNLKKYSIAIADIGISFTFDRSLLGNKIKYCRDQFLSDNGAEIKLNIHRGNVSGGSAKKLIFDSGTNWSLYRDEGKYILQNCSFSSGNQPEKLIVLKPDFKSGDIYLTNDKSYRSPPFDITRHTLIQTLIIFLLSRGRGVMLHACGINDCGEGYLFVGRSGYGKSTLARLWSKSSASILSDDRIIVREIDGRFFMYGTPWQGDTKLSSKEKVLLKKIFFLKHAKQNTAKKIPPMEATSFLLARSFPTFWDKKGMDFSLRFCSQLANSIPSYELGFLPDYSAIDFIKNHI